MGAAGVAAHFFAASLSRPLLRAAIVDRSAWMDRISIDPRIHGGEPCIKGTRIPVSVVVGSIADGDDVEAIRKAYPALAAEDVRACLKYAAESVRDAHWLPLGG